MTYRIPISMFISFLEIFTYLPSCGKVLDFFIFWIESYRALKMGCSLETQFWVRILLKLFQYLKVFKLGSFFYMQTLMISIDVSKFILVHIGEVLKDLNTKNNELYEKGCTKNSVLVPSVSACLDRMENVFEPKIFKRCN